MKNKKILSINFYKHNNFVKLFSFLFRKSILVSILFFCFLGILGFLFVKKINASSIQRKLPYNFNESFIVSQGYNSPPTHIKKDKYAIDFTKNACEVYGKNVISADSGKVLLVENDGYNGGYGSQVLIINDGNIVTRYAHLISHSISLKEGDNITQGDLIGKIGNTGLAIGLACKEHPGSHLHFAVYSQLANGTYEAQNPEPISGYTDIKEGNWYISDNKKDIQQLGNINSIIDNIARIFGSKNLSDKFNDNSLVLNDGIDISNNLPTTKSSSSENIISENNLNFQNNNDLLSNETTSAELYDVNQSDDFNSDNNLQTFTTSSINNENIDESNLISDNNIPLETDTSTIVVSSTDLLNDDSNNLFVSTSTTVNINYSQNDSSDYSSQSTSSYGGYSGSVSVFIPDPVVSSNNELNQLSEGSLQEDQSSVSDATSNSSSTEILPIEDSSSTNISNLDNASSSVAIDGANSSSTTTIDQNNGLNNISSNETNNSSTTVNIDVSSTTDNLPQTESSTESSPYNFSSLILSPTPIGSGQLAYFDPNLYALNFSWSQVLNTSGTYDGIIYSIFDLTDQSVTSSLTKDQLGSLMIGGGAIPLWSGTSTQYSYPVSSGGNHHFYILASDHNRYFSYFDQNIYVPNVFSVVQPINNVDSHWSWYDDNWYDLGTGFYGTLHSITLEGYINDPMYSNSHLSIQEFLDSNYTILNNQFIISDNAPFTNEDKKITINGLNIIFWPNKYYRLVTNQNYQNRSVILKGTDTKGVGMWDAFVFGTGIVRTNYTFYPYISWGFENNFPPLMPPISPPNIYISFDQDLEALKISWNSGIDPFSDISYETNFSDSPTFNDAMWRPVSKNLFTLYPIDIIKPYYIAVRAIDDFGNKSMPTIQVWNPQPDITTSTIPIVP